MTTPTPTHPTTDEPTAIELPDLCLVVLVGASGSGKSTFARNHFRDTEVLSSDTFRGLVADDPTDQGATVDAFGALFDVAGRRLRRGLLTVVDATSVRPEDRRSLLGLAKEHDVFAVAVVLDVELDVLKRRSASRTDVDEAVVVRQHRLLRQHGKNLRKEGFRFVHRLIGAAAAEKVNVSRTRLFNDLTDQHGPFDIIGDVHGCCAELETLLRDLGWTVTSSPDGAVGVLDHPEGRRAVFVGDLVDRGPDTPGVLRLVMSMVTEGQAICVRGNHEEKLLRALRQRAGGRRADKPVQLTHGLAESVQQLDSCSAGFRSAVIEFLDGLVSHYVLDEGRLVVSHAGLPQRYHGRTSGRVRNLAMYGETTGEQDRWGYPIRVDWARDYRGDARVVYGHTPVPSAAWTNNTLCLDTGCVFGGRLTALRYPEGELVDVPAGRTYWPSERPMGYGDSAADARVRAALNLDDVVGKRTVTTRFGPPVTVREENAAAALEVMSRYTVDPRWLRYLPPTMSPAGSVDPDLLEDPQSAFAAYAELGVTEVICEEKHMGSRAVVVVTRDDDAARLGFGVYDGGLGTIYTRTGRPFFEPATTATVLARIRAAAQDVFDDLGCRRLILDAELLPWNIKGEGLIRDHFASVPAAAEPELALLTSELRDAAERGLDVAEQIAVTTRRSADVSAFADALLRYVRPGAGVDDIRIATFEVLAAGAEGADETFENRPHTWHLEIADRLAGADPELFTTTRRRVVDTGSERSRADGAAWWAEMMADGGEGMVVKPISNLVRDARNRVVVPGLKVRGAEYLRLIYGPSYLGDLHRLRSRDLRHKRSMAMREYQLAREALARHREGAPLWRIHECVFAILACESEPVDSRL